MPLNQIKMYPQFFCFVDSEPELKLVGIIKGLLDLDYAPFVDAKNKDNKGWFRENLKHCEHRLYWFNEEGGFTAGIWNENLERPDLLVVFSAGVKVSLADWTLMGYLIQKVHCTSKISVSDEELEMVFKVFEKPSKVTNVVTEKEVVVKLPDSYAFRSAIIGDTAFFEIVKPNVIEPYVTMVEEYEKYPMDQYTNWFKCLSFGVSGYDAAFIHKLYREHHKKDLDLEVEFKKRVERVLKLKDEPRIWRNSLENVMENYSSGGLNGVGDKRKMVGEEIVESVRRIV